MIDYNSLQPHQQRVMDEYTELHERVFKLNQFTEGEVFPTLSSVDKDLLTQQLKCMQQYVSILYKRIERF